MARYRFSLLLLFVLICTVTPVYAGFLGSVWNGIKSGGGAIVSGAKSAIGTAGGVVRWGVGATTGQVVGGVFDPTIDHAADRLQDAGNHIVDHAGEQLSKVLNEEIKNLDAVEKNRIDQLDAVMKTRLDQTDSILNKNLDKLDVITSQMMDREAHIIDSALGNEQQILNQSLDRVDTILDKDLTRLQSVETDAFDRVEAATQDQIPFAASRVAREIEFTSLVIIFLILLVGYGGAQLFRHAMASDKEGLWAKFLYALRTGGYELLLVGVPMVLIAILIQAGYHHYYTTADEARISRLDDAASLLEKAGDFGAAGSFRRRSASLTFEPLSRFRMQRDIWLADFNRPTLPDQKGELEDRLLAMKTNYTDAFAADLELRAAELYLDERSLRDLAPPSDREGASTFAKYESELSRNIDNYLEELDKLPISPNDASKKTPKAASPYPVFGKLVYMAKLRMVLDSHTSDLGDRIKAGENIAKKMLDKYPTYPTGLVAYVQLQALEADANELSLSAPSEKETERIRSSIETELGAAANQDEKLVKLLSVAAFDLPKDTTEKLIVLASVPVASRKADKVKEAEQALDAAAMTLQRQAQGVVGSDVVARLMTDHEMPIIMRRSIGEAQLKSLVDEARKAKRSGDYSTVYHKAINIANAADAAGQPLAAELWLNTAKQTLNDNPGITASPEETKFMESYPVTSRAYNGSAGLAYVF